jgi:hypothetical protein
MNSDELYCARESMKVSNYLLSLAHRKVQDAPEGEATRLVSEARLLLQCATLVAKDVCEDLLHRLRMEGHTDD